jgi:hypothetical protein
VLIILRCKQTSFYSNSNGFRFKSGFISPTFTGTVSGIDKTMVDLVMWIIQAMRTNLSALPNCIRFKANLASPTLQELFLELINNGGFRNVDNTSDVNKPVSTATQKRFRFKGKFSFANIYRNCLGIDKAMVGLEMWTTQATNKPIS